MGRGRQGGQAQGHTVNQCFTDSRLDVPRKALEVTLNAPFIQETFFLVPLVFQAPCWALELQLGSQRWA